MPHQIELRRFGMTPQSRFSRRGSAARLLRFCLRVGMRAAVIGLLLNVVSARRALAYDAEDPPIAMAPSGVKSST